MSLSLNSLMIRFMVNTLYFNAKVLLEYRIYYYYHFIILFLSLSLSLSLTLTLSKPRIIRIFLTISFHFASSFQSKKLKLDSLYYCPFVVIVVVVVVEITLQQTFSN